MLMVSFRLGVFDYRALPPDGLLISAKESLRSTLDLLSGLCWDAHHSNLGPPGPSLVDDRWRRLVGYSASADGPGFAIAGPAVCQ